MKNSLIETFTCQSSDFVLIRKGQEKPLPVSLYGTLQTGDQIHVFREGCSITLLLNDNERVTVDYATTKVQPYPVPTVDVPSKTIVGNMIEFASNWLNELSQPRQEDSIDIGARGRELAIPLLVKNNAKLVAGKNTVYLAWKGGKLPYWLKVQRNHRPAENWEATTINATTIALKKPDFELQPNTYYWVRLKDSLENEVIMRFEVVTDLQMSQSAKTEEQAIRESRIDERIKRTLRAAWLAKPGKEWRFEAYQQVAGEDNYRPALLIKEALEAGKQP